MVKWEVRYLQVNNLVIIVSLKGLCFALSSFRVPCPYANCTRWFLEMHTRADIRLISQLARYPPWRMTTCVFRRCVNPVGAVSYLVSYTSERGNIGAISTRANSRTVDLHTYRRFGGAAWLELRRNGVYTRYTRTILSDLSSAMWCTLFWMSDLEIYDTPGSRA